MVAARIVLDYGHGGSKPGAIYGGVEEKTVNLLLGQELYGLLREAPEKPQALLTRDADYDVPLSVRTALINAHHKRKPIDLVVSIHFNAFPKPTLAGFEVYHHARSTRGKTAAEHLAREARAAGVPIRGAGTITTARLGRKLAIIHKTEPPSVLVEVGYLTNPVDRANAANPGFRTQVAEALMTGITNYLADEVA